MKSEFLRSSHIRSYVLRQGRVSNAQQRCYDNLMPLYGIPYTALSLDLENIFGRDAPKILEIGFGMGESTATIAQAHLENDYLAIEVHTPGVGSLLKQIEEKHLGNIRLIQHDAVEVLRDMLADNVLDGAHIFFPDPWHKTRHNKRRLIQAPFIAQLVQRLKPGGYLHIATDWQDYAEQVLAVLNAEGCAPQWRGSRFPGELGRWWRCFRPYRNRFLGFLARLCQRYFLNLTIGQCRECHTAASSCHSSVAVH